MSGYGWYIGASVGLCLIVLVWNIFVPFRQWKKLIRTGKRHHGA